MNKFVSFLFLVTAGYCAMAELKQLTLRGSCRATAIQRCCASGNTLYISGKGGVLPGTRTVPDNPKEEARLLMEDFKTTLERVT